MHFNITALRYFKKLTPHTITNCAPTSDRSGYNVERVAIQIHKGPTSRPKPKFRDVGKIKKKRKSTALGTKILLNDIFAFLPRPNRVEREMIARCSQMNANQIRIWVSLLHTVSTLITNI